MHLFACTRHSAAMAAALFAGALAACAHAPATQASRLPAVSRLAPRQISVESRLVILPRDALAALAAKLPAIKVAPANGFSVGLLDNRDLSLFLRAINVMQDATSMGLPRKTLFDGATVSIPASVTQNYITSFHDLNKPAPSGTIDTGFSETLSPTISRNRRSITLRFTVAANPPSRVGTLTPTSPKEIHGTFAIPDGESAAISGFSIIDPKGKVYTSVMIVRLKILPRHPAVATTRPGT